MDLNQELTKLIMQSIDNLKTENKQLKEENLQLKKQLDEHNRRKDNFEQLVKEYHIKIKEYQFWKDHYDKLKYKFNNTQNIYVEKQISRYTIEYIPKENIEEIIKHEISTLIARELVNSNSITIVRETNTTDQITIRAKLEFIKP